MCPFATRKLPVMCRKSFVFDILIMGLLVVLCQTMYHIRTKAPQPFCPLFISLAKQDAVIVQKELSRFFLYLSDLLRPTTIKAAEVPLFLTQLDELSAQLARAHHLTQNRHYNETQRLEYQQEIFTLLGQIENTAHEYLKSRTSARLLTPAGLSKQITTEYVDAKKSITLTQQAHDLFVAMRQTPVKRATPISSVEEGLKENEHLLERLELSKDTRL